MSIDYLILPDKKLHHNKVQVPVEDHVEDLLINMVIIKGVHDMPQNAGCHATNCLVYEHEYDPEACIGVAHIYDIKHMVLADLHQHSKLMTYFHDQDCTTYPTIRKHLAQQYDGIIDGEIVTLVFFTPNQDLLDGTQSINE